MSRESLDRFSFLSAGAALGVFLALLVDYQMPMWSKWLLLTIAFLLCALSGFLRSWKRVP